MEKQVFSIRAGLLALVLMITSALPVFTPVSDADSRACKHLYMGHSFFRRSAESMSFHAAELGITGYSQHVVFRGGANGAPQALWEAGDTKQEIIDVLDGNDVCVFAMTYHSDYPTLEGYNNWISYARERNPNTEIVIALPWQGYPASFTGQEYHDESYAAHDNLWHRHLIDPLRDNFPGTKITCLPYGLGTAETRLMFDQGQLSADVVNLQGPANNSLHTDTLGHGGDLTIEISDLHFVDHIFDVDMSTYAYEPPFNTDLKAITKSVMDEHDAQFGDATDSRACRHLYIGHSFFRPSAERMSFHAAELGITGYSQDVVFRGGPNGAPQSLWEDLTAKAEIQDVLNDGDVCVFVMTYHPDQPTLDGYNNWIGYALGQNPDTDIVIALPWQSYPTSVTAQEYYDNSYAAHDSLWHSGLIDPVRANFPGTKITCLPYGLGTAETRLMFDQGLLSADVVNLEGPANNSLHTDNLGHGGDITKEISDMFFVDVLFDVDMAGYLYEPPFNTDLKAITKTVMDEHDALFGGGPVGSTTTTTSTTSTTSTTLAPAAGCSDTPRSGCRTAARASLQFADHTDDSNDRITLKLIKVEATTQSEFGNPVMATHYDLCVYASAAQSLYVEANVPDDQRDWAALGDKGFKYRSRDALEDGTEQILLKGHPTAAKTKIMWKGAGVNLPISASLPLPNAGFPLRVQVSASDAECFETVFELSDVSKNETGSLKIKKR